MQTNNIALADLRIGSLIWSNRHAKICCVQSIQSGGYELITCTFKDEIFIETNHIENFSGLPITEEWLIKIGYHNIDGIFIHEKRVPYCIETFNGVFVLKNGNGDHIKPIVYIHSLQNLWQSLTGTELTLK